MMSIFKYFFSIIGGLILIYVLFIMIRTVFYSSINTAQTVVSSEKTKNIGTTTAAALSTFTAFSLTKWLNDFHPFQFSPVYVGTDAANSHSSFFGTGQMNGLKTQQQVYEESKSKISTTHPTDWAPVGEFDTRWSGSGRNQGNVNTQTSLDQDPERNIYMNDVSNFSEEVAMSPDKLKQDKLKATYVTPYLQVNTRVRNSQVVHGYAFFKVFSNRSFPVLVLNEKGLVIGSSKAFVNGDVNPNGYVNFRVVLSFMSKSAKSGFVVFKNENSELSGISAETVVPIDFYSSYIFSNMPKMLFPSNYLDK